MANRGSFHTPMPRQIKRLINLMTNVEDPHHRGVIKRLFLDAHAHHRNFKNKSAHFVDVNESEEVANTEVEVVAT